MKPSCGQTRQGQGNETVASGRCDRKPATWPRRSALALVILVSVIIGFGWLERYKPFRVSAVFGSRAEAAARNFTQEQFVNWLKAERRRLKWRAHAGPGSK